MRAFLIGLLVAMSSAQAQNFVPPVGLPIPQLQNRIPAPLPPPAQPPVINGPLSQPASPRVYQAPQLTSSSPKINSCLREGRKRGLRGEKLDAYTRECAKPDSDEE